MPEQAINTAKDEPVVSVPSEGDSVDVNLQEEKQETQDSTQPEVVTQESQGEELEEYSDKVKTRINKLTGKLREAERREQASFQYAKRVADENKKLKAKSNSLDASYIQEFEARTQIETKKAEQDLQTAIQAGDASAQVEAQKALAKLSIDNERLLATKEAKESLKEEQKEDVTPEQLQAAPPKKVDPKAEAWAEKNPWFGKDEAMTYASFGIHKKLVEEEGFNPNSDEYYAEIDNRIKNEFPHKFGANSSESTRPVQPVASAGRSTTQSTSGRKTVRLSPSQVHIAKRLGVPLEEYAKYVKE